MNGSDSCNNTENDGNFIRLGPETLYEVFGITIPILYLATILLVAFLWAYALYFVKITTSEFRTYVSFLQCSPALHVTLTLPALLSPPSAPLVSLLQDMVAVFSMLSFTILTIRILGGVEYIVKIAETTHPTSCPIATPPLCCLFPCKKPNITPKIMKLVILPVKLLSSAIIINFLINLFLVYSGFYPINDLSDITNIHNILIIPFFISCMYTYKVFVTITSSFQLNPKHRLRGILFFVMFVLCKSSFGIINLLVGHSVIPCLHGLPSYWLGILIVSLVQIVGVSTIGLVIPRIYSGNIERMKKETKEVESCGETKSEQSKLVEEVMEDVD